MKMKKKVETGRRIYTTAAAAELLNSNELSIRRLIKAEKLKAYKKLRKWYILEVDIIAYIKSDD
jgi:hypothetical protein